MTKIHLRFVVEDVDRHGNVRRYFRRKGQPKIRLLGQPGSPEFMNAYQIALGGERLPTRKKASHRNKQSSVGTLKWLCEAYFGSAEFKGLDPRTKRVRRNILDNLCRENGDKPVRLMEPRHVRSIRDERAERPEAANATLKALRQIFVYGVATELVDRNPAKDVPYLKSSSQGFHSWTDDEVRKFEATHPVGSKARLAAPSSHLCPPSARQPWMGGQHSAGRGVGRSGFVRERLLRPRIVAASDLRRARPRPGRRETPLASGVPT